MGIHVINDMALKCKCVNPHEGGSSLKCVFTPTFHVLSINVLW